MATSILLIEPVTAERLHFKQVIANTDYVICHETATADDVSHLYMKYRPDLVVMSIVSTGKGGLQLLKELKQVHPDIRVLMTFNPTKGAFLVSKTMESGAAGYIRKPFKSEEVLEKLARVKESAGGAAGVRKRKAARLEKVLMVRYKAIQKGIMGLFAKEVIGFSEDISTGGLGLKTSVAHAEGDNLRMAIQLPNSKKPVKAEGVIRRAKSILKGQSYSVGVEFTKIEPVDLDRIDTYVIQVTTHGEGYFQMAQPIVVHCKKAGDYLGAKKKGFTNYLGVSSFYLTCRSPFPDGSELDIEIEWGEKVKEQISLVGEVKKTIEVTKGMVYDSLVSIKDIDPEAGKKLGTLIRDMAVDASTHG
ncbi:MAG: PilZ domain-containing protein [Planctomycetes bacterium]|nr:PilZ domain-containing protein [Planctomycetota bacterium]